ncbi:response regulator transcription factor [Arcobacter sp. FWKO B]|uniref:response regulator transcription factor n=1 Tax=Arcobacter sp. FWKO B TaxID=2593672 RepID=UPI0018A5C5CF|nr:response regulator transcription factor [Arcobacter sp. FWKO B]QOG12933.1 response regulator transcription factor [Arcobacter sp. FWKO B]
MVDNVLFLKNKTVLFAEDDTIMKTQITEILEMLFKKVCSVSNGKEAYESYLCEQPDLIITDIKMPSIDGLTLVEKIRKRDYETPIIMITSFSEQELLLNATNLSIDGYILKPIDLNSLVKAITKSMQRANKNQGLIDLGSGIYYNTGTQELYKNGEIVILGHKELELIKLLISKFPKTVSKEEISETLWPYEAICESAIKNLVLRIRKKILEELVVSVRGVGYRLTDFDGTK